MAGHSDPSIGQLHDELRSLSKNNLQSSAIGAAESRTSHKGQKTVSSLAGRSTSGGGSSFYTRDAVSALEQFPVVPSRSPHEPKPPKQVKRGRAGAQMPLPLTVFNVHAKPGHHGGEDEGTAKGVPTNKHEAGGARRAERVADMVAQLTEIFQRKLMERMEREMHSNAQQQHHQDAMYQVDSGDWETLHLRS